MPLGPDVGQNVKELYTANKTKPPGQQRPRKQILAIAESAAKGQTGVGADHPGFAAVQSKIAKTEGIPKKNAGAILAAASRKASPKAIKANPRLKRVQR